MHCNYLNFFMHVCVPAEVLAKFTGTLVSDIKIKQILKWSTNTQNFYF